MYSPDRHDRVVEQDELPKPSVGAPLPFVMSNDNSLILGYRTRTLGSVEAEPRIVDGQSAGELIAFVQFRGHLAFHFGYPNEEAFAGHPLFSRGLRPHSIAQIQNSSWIRDLESQNTIHPGHDPNQFKKLKHYVFAFHDSTFECIATGHDVVIRVGPFADLWPEVREGLGW
jgi:hypothetical protein